MPVILSECVPGLRLRRLSGPEGGFEIESPDGPGPRVRSYREFELLQAVEDYQRALCATLEPAAAEVFSMVIDLSVAMGDRDFTAFGELVADEIAYVDHRPIGYERLDRDSSIELMAEFADDPNRYLPRAVHIATAAGIVTTGGWWMRHLDDWREFEVGVTVTVVRDARVLRADLFPEGDVDAAIAMFRSLTEP